MKLSKNIQYKILGGISAVVGIIGLASIAYGINTVADGWRTYGGVTYVINADNQCYRASGADIFIPTRTMTEFNSLLPVAASRGLNLPTCSFHYRTSGCGACGAIRPGYMVHYHYCNDEISGVGVSDSYCDNYGPAFPNGGSNPYGYFWTPCGNACGVGYITGWY